MYFDALKVYSLNIFQWCLATARHPDLEFFDRQVAIATWHAWRGEVARLCQQHYPPHKQGGKFVIVMLFPLVQMRYIL